MINNNMRLYNYFTFGEKNSYGQAKLSEDVKGFVKMAIYTSNQSTVDNILYKDANYIGLTKAEVNDTFVIQYGKEKLKVLYVIPQGRYKQVFLKRI